MSYSRTFISFKVLYILKSREEGETNWIDILPMYDMMLHATRWLYAFGDPYALQCYIAVKHVRRRKLLEIPWLDSATQLAQNT